MLPREKIKLGLDLQGGMHLILEVDAMKAVESDLERVVEDIKEDLRSERIRYTELRRDGTEGIDITLMREADKGVLDEMVKSRYNEFEIKEGSASGEGYPVSLKLKAEAKNQTMKLATDQAIETIRNRIDQFGVNEPDIRPQEDNRILIQLPGIKDPERAIELIGKTAQLEFKLVDDENREKALNGDIPAGREILYGSVVDPTTGATQKQAYRVIPVKRALETSLQFR